MLFAVFTYQKKAIKTYKEFLGTCITLHLALQHVKISMSLACLSWHVQFFDPLTKMFKN